MMSLEKREVVMTCAMRYIERATQMDSHSIEFLQEGECLLALLEVLENSYPGPYKETREAFELILNDLKGERK